MKHMKRILALALALMLTLGLATTAFAVEGDETEQTPPADQMTAQTGTFTVTINNATGHTYQIYQIFTGDLATKEEVSDGKTVTVEILSNLKYGEDYLPTGKTVNDPVADADLQKAQAFKIEPTGTGDPMTVNGDTAIAENLAAGYYMIKDTSTNLPAGEEQSAVIFQVVGDTNITSKHTGTTIVKKVQDINDTTGEYTTHNGDTWIDSADWDIGDTVPFKSTANFEGLDNYETYKVIFTDTMAKGLTYNGDMKISITGAEGDVTDSFHISTSTYAVSPEAENYDADYEGGTVITITCDDITALTTANSVTIVLNYTAVLNDEANLGAPGNPNKIKVTTKPDGTGETPEDVNIVFTFRVDVDKYTTIDGTETALKGAGFTLYKEVADAETEGAETGATIKTELNTVNSAIKADALKDNAYYIIAAEVEVDANGATFGFNGIDDGTYVLVETQIPAGYNAWNAEEFAVEATHDVTADDPELKTLTGGNLFTGTVSTGILKGKVENNAGVELPETGGIGTTIFYVVGGLLAVAAVVLLVTKKRMNTAE